MSSMDLTDPRFIKAMSHPLRVRLLAMLRERTSSPRDLAAAVGHPLGVVSYHVRTLQRLGLVELVDETTVRGAVQHHYRALPPPTVTDETWAQASSMAKQAAVGSTLQIIGEYAAASAAAGGFDRGDAHITRTSMRLDPQGWSELSRACMALLDDADEIAARAKRRLAEDPHREASDAGFVMMLFDSVRLSDSDPVAQAAMRGVRQPAGAPE